MRGKSPRALALPLGELSPQATERALLRSPAAPPLRLRFAQPPLPKGEAKGCPHEIITRTGTADDPAVPVNCLMRPAHWPGFGSFGRRRVVVAAEFEVFKFDGRAFGVHGARGGLGRGGGWRRSSSPARCRSAFEVVRDLRRDFFSVLTLGAGAGRARPCRPASRRAFRARTSAGPEPLPSSDPGT